MEQIVSSLDRVTLGLIDFYKTNLAESVLFRNKTCSFVDDTCSWYGKRVVGLEGAVAGYGLIRERMRRCGDFKIFAFDKQTLGWGRGFDTFMDDCSEQHVGGFVEYLHQQHERREGIGHVLQGMQVVHSYVYGERSDVIGKFIEQENVQEYRVRVRSAKGYERYFQEQLLRKLSVIGAGELGAVMEQVSSEVMVVPVGVSVGYVLWKYVSDKKKCDYFVKLGEIKKQ